MIGVATMKKFGKITRRAALYGAGGLLMARPTQQDPLAGARLYQDVVSYAGMGGHRTGSTIDMKTSEWMRDGLAKAGFQTEYLQCKSRNVFELRKCVVETGGVVYAGDPEWFPTATGPRPVTAPLVRLAEGAPLSALRGKIWMLEDPRGDLSLDGAIKERVDQAGKAGALAAVVAINTASGELLGRTVPPEQNEAPWCSIPLVGVAWKHRDALFAAAARNAEAGVIVDGEVKPGVRPRNVMGRIGKGKDVIVVTTPISALTQSGGERGPGIAILLGLARWLSQRQPRCRYLFSGNTGHETHGTGAYALLGVLPPPAEVRAWLHLGASIANRYPATSAGLMLDEVAVQRRAGTVGFVSAPVLVPILQKAFADIPGLRPTTEAALGELPEYLKRGYRAFGFFGGNRVFHTWGDGPEQAVPELMERVARALARSLDMIEKMAV